MQIKDIYNREFKTLRVSLLSKCNLSCVYCTMGDDDSKVAGQQVAAQTLLPQIARLHQILQLQTIRLTGGEPLLYKELAILIKGIQQMGVPEIKLTTNGFLLQRQAQSLAGAGLQSVNVSLDAVEEGVFFSMSRRSGVQKIIEGIDAAIAAGLKVKINAVIMKGINENQIIPLLNFADERGAGIRFLEIMAMGHLHDTAEKYLFTQQEILNVVRGEFAITSLRRNHSATANYWQTSGGHVFGIIANESEPFCADCNRLRLDSNGNIYGCLSSNNPIQLGADDTESTLMGKLQLAMQQKQLIKFTGSDLSMLKIGG